MSYGSYIDATGAFRVYTLCRKSNILGLLRTISNSTLLGLVNLELLI
jgi:hypothetical protein